MFDIEYVFLKIRSKSVGESVDLNLICPDDGVTSVRKKININFFATVTSKQLIYNENINHNSSSK